MAEIGQNQTAQLAAQIARNQSFQGTHLFIVCGEQLNPPSAWGAGNLSSKMRECTATNDGVMSKWVFRLYSDTE
jgi:hypothetical protein